MTTDKEFAGWSQRDIDAAIINLSEKIENGADWDEDGSYRLDMATEILKTYFAKAIDYEDKWFEIQQIIAKYILNWSIEAVTCDPDKYCEKIAPNDDL